MPGIQGPGDKEEDSEAPFDHWTSYPRAAEEKGQTYLRKRLAGALLIMCDLSGLLLEFGSENASMAVNIDLTTFGEEVFIRSPDGGYVGAFPLYVNGTRA